MQSYNSKEPIVDPVATRVYGSRYYVLAMVSMASILNNEFWASWGPISQSVQLVYGWSDKTLFWVTNVGNISAFVFTLLGCYLVDRKGIRVATLACAAFNVLTATSRIITTAQPAATILISIGQFFNGLATAVTMTIPPAVAEVWFHVHERTTATAVSAMSMAAGAAAAYLFGPLLVSMPEMNGTTILLNGTDVPKIENEMRTYNYINFGLTVALLLGCLVYLPARPPIEPSVSAQTPRFNFWAGVRQLICMPTMWLIAVTYAVPMGFFGNWSSMIDVILGPEVVSQKEAGWVAFGGTIGGIVMGLVLARFVDHFKFRMKQLIFVNYLVGTAMFIWFTCMCQGWLPLKQGFVYTAVILSGVTISSTSPLFIEISCETSYPVAEGVTAGFLGMLVNLGAALVLACIQIKGIGASWMNWTVSGVYLAALPFVALMRVQYRKVHIDTTMESNLDSSMNS